MLLRISFETIKKKYGQNVLNYLCTMRRSRNPGWSNDPYTDLYCLLFIRLKFRTVTLLSIQKYESKS